MILITGASGNTGREVLKQTILAGHQVRAAYQSADKATDKAAGAPAGVEAVIVDYNQPETLQTALQGVDSVFLVGPVAPTLVELERKATDVIQRSGVRRLVKLSAMGTEEATFPRQHHQSEDYIRSLGIGYTFLRPNGFMQNMVFYNGATIRGQGVFYGCQGDGKVSHIDLRDIAEVAAKTLTEDSHLGKTYTLTGPEAVSNARIAQILSAALQREVKYVDLSPEDMKKAMMGAGSPEWSANGIIDLNQLYRKGGASEVTADVERVLGRKPTSFEQFARDYASSF
jgi:uncharacterized protein YbjT (DUF2867 family)